MLTADTKEYGPLPMFPCLDYRPITADRIECRVEALFDCADREFLAGRATQAQYDTWSKALRLWADEQYRKIKGSA